MGEFLPEDSLDEIDYLHPDGKPPANDEEQLGDGKPSWRNLRIALAEADGHYMPKRDPYLKHDW